MIKRTAKHTINTSLVNTADNEHQNVVGAIKDGAPVTDLSSVVKSINFDIDVDGAYVLRHPLLLKETISQDTVFLYDAVSKFNSNEKIIDGTVDSVSLVYYDNSSSKQRVYMSNSIANLSFITKYYKHINIKDGTVLSVSINRAAFDEFVQDYPSMLYPNENLYYNDAAGELYRFIKIYKDPDSLDTSDWIVEIVYPELNTIVSGLDVGNTDSLDFNLLLDNPYAIRDLYNYGDNSTTKILPYTIDIELDYDNLKVYELTESKNPSIHLIESLNTVQPVSAVRTVLKAFITTAKYLQTQNMKFYCCWEYSTNGGIDWTVSQAFLNKFANSGRLVTKNVMDITSSEFEKRAYNDDLSNAADYIIEKKMVEFDPNLSENDKLIDRPDVLELNSTALAYLYRFQIYVDTGKTYPKVNEDDVVTLANTSKTTFINDGSAGKVKFGDTDPGNKITYQTYISGGVSESSAKTFHSKMNAKWVNRSGSEFYRDVYFVNSKDSIVNGVRAYAYINGKYQDIGYVEIISIITRLVYIKGNNYQAIYANQNTITDLEIPVVYDYNYIKADLKENNTLLLHRGSEFDTNCGNTLVISTSSSEYQIIAIKVNTANNTNNAVKCTTGSVEEVSSISLFEDYKTSEADGNIYIYNGDPTDDAAKQALGYSEVTIANCSNSEDVKISSITVYLKKANDIKTTSTYLYSSTGSFRFTYSEDEHYVKDLTYYREQLFKGELVFYDDQLISFNKYSVYFSNKDSFIVKTLNNLTFGDIVTKVVKWRSYLIIFTTNTITLAKYDSTSNSYTLKTVSTNIGVSSTDADTVLVILNTIYFKSFNKVYKLTFNAYTSDDSLLNLRFISIDINNIMTEFGIYIHETRNFSLADDRFYYIFVPSKYDVENRTETDVTYCLKYDYTKNTWTIAKYNLRILDVESLSINESYLRTEYGLCYFKDDPRLVFANSLTDYYLKREYVGLGGVSNNVSFILGADLGTESNKLVCFKSDAYEDTPTYTNMLELYDELPYADYFSKSLNDIYSFVKANADSQSSKPFETLYNDIEFSIDFGQKSSTYTIFKQYLETKFTFGTLQSRDTFPISLDIETDGESMLNKPNGIHIDTNTDSALWKTDLDHKGTLNTTFGYNADTNYNGIMRQLVVKYSGRGKTIRYLLKGKSKSKFKFYSLDTRYRILAKKQ